jgi:hypothetical protein
MAERASASGSWQRYWLPDAYGAVLAQPQSRKPVAEPSPGWQGFLHRIRPVIKTVSGIWHLVFRFATDRLHPLVGLQTRLACADLIDFSFTPGVAAFYAHNWL